MSPGDPVFDLPEKRRAIDAGDEALRPEVGRLEQVARSVPGFIGLVHAPFEEPLLLRLFQEKAPPQLPDSVHAPDGWKLQMVENAKPTHLRQPVSQVTHIEEAGVETPTPSASTGIGPGSPMLQTIPGEGTFICTANFVFRDGAKFYLGSAGHCFLPEGKKATHGPDADYNAANVVVQVCVANCLFGGFLTGFLGTMKTLGPVSYARQTGPGGDIGNDFGVVEIPASLHSLIRPHMPVWFGPTGERSAEGLGTPVVHYGNGIDAGTVFATKGRAGSSLNDGEPTSWQANVLINGGDSGSAINHAAASVTTDVVRGTDALGLVTHGLIVPGVPLGWGTTITQARTMAVEANLNLVLMKEGEAVEGSNSAPTASFSGACTQLRCDFDGRGSSDSDGTIISYAWEFGDGSSGSGATMSHTYAANGTYTVILTVTDDGGETGQDAKVLTVSSSGITLTARGYKVQGVQHADLSWSGASSANVDLVRNGVIVTTTPNDGEHTDNIGKKGSGSYTYKICEAASSLCSNEATVSF